MKEPVQHESVGGSTDRVFRSPETQESNYVIEVIGTPTRQILRGQVERTWIHRFDLLATSEPSFPLRYDQATATLESGMTTKFEAVFVKYQDMLSFQKDVGETGRFVLHNGIPVNMVFDFMAEGFPPDEIAERMHLSLDEVRRIHEFINDLL